MTRRFFSWWAGFGALVFFGGLALGADREERRISVSGECSRAVIPDRGALVVVSEFRDDDLKTASRRATDAYGRAREAVKRLGLPDLELEIVEYSLGEVKEWQKDRHVSKGYRARMGLRVVTSQVDRLGEVIAIAAREGLQAVGGLQSFLSSGQELRERIACLQDAAANARTKAEKLATALGAKVGEPLTITESGGEQAPIRPMLLGMGEEVRAAAAPAVVEAGRQSLSLKVDVAFALK